MSILKLMEKAPAVAPKTAEIIAGFLSSTLDVEEMRNKRGSDYDTTKFYQIRVKPLDKDTPLETVLTKIEKALKSNSKKLGLSEVQINKSSRNSGKFSSISFSKDEIDYDIVVAKGTNNGMQFEKDLLVKMDNLISGVDTDEEALEAFKAIQLIDSTFKVSNILSVVPRTGTTFRSGNITPEETGKITADIVVKMKNGSERYISVKNKDGSTVAQFGLAKAFNEDLTVNTDSTEWKTWLKPFALDVEKIEIGLEAARDGLDIPFPDIEQMSKKVKGDSEISKILRKMWGLDYYYLRHKGTNDFHAILVNKEYVDEKLLKNLKVVEIRYPSKDRKQLSIYLESETMRFKLEVRNPRGKGSVKPTQIQLTIMKGGR